MKTKHTEWVDVKVSGVSLIHVNQPQVKVTFAIEGDNREAVLLLEQRLMKSLKPLADGEPRPWGADDHR